VTTKYDLTLVIDGIPVLFGTMSGLVQTDCGFIDSVPASLTSVDALVLDSVQVEGNKLNYDTMMVMPGAASMRLRSSSTWDKFFERRRTPKTRLTALMSPTTQTASVGSSSGFVEEDVCYVDRECILIGTVSAGQLGTADNTRNYAGIDHRAAAHQIGSVVSASPRSLLGKAANLYLWTDEVSPPTFLRRLVLAKVEWDGASNTWDLSFNDAMSLLDKKLCVGFDGDAVSSIALVGSNQKIQFGYDSNDITQWLDTAGADNGALLVTGGDGYLLSPILSYSGGQLPQVSADAAYSEFGDLFQGDSNTSAVGVADAGLHMRRVTLLTDTPMVCALKAMLSEHGDGNNHATYDVLYGYTSAYTGGSGDVLAVNRPEVRMGAGIPASLLNLTTTSPGLLEPGLLAETTDGWQCLLGDKGPEDLLTLLEEVGWADRGQWFFNAAGKLSFKRSSAVYAFTSVAATLDETDILVGSSLKAVDDETEVIHSVKLKLNKEPAGDFMGEVNLIYPRTAETFRDIGRTLEQERKHLVVALPSEPASLRMTSTSQLPGSLEGLRARYDRQFFRRQNGLRKYSLTLPIRFYALTPGDVVTVTHERLKSFDGSTVTAQTFEVTSTGSLDFKAGTMTVEVTETWNGKPLSPTAKVSAWDAGTKTFTFATNSKYGGGTTPGAYFEAGWKVRCFDASASPQFSTASAVLTVVDATDTTMTVDAAPAFAPAAGDIVVQAQYDDADNTSVNPAQAIAQRGHAFQADDNFRLGTANDAAHEWA